MDPRREAMIERQLVARGLDEPRLLAAFRAVPRESFVAPELRDRAYEDGPLPIEDGQTISQPYVVAFTASALALQGGERLLEVGTGSGYAAAVLSRLVKHVVTIERSPVLARLSAERLRALGYLNVEVHLGDGSLGWPDAAPYDAIAVAAAAPRVPRALAVQLELGGRLVIPVGKTERSQQLLRVTRLSADRWSEEPLLSVAFVPLVGAQGFRAPEP